MKKIIFIVIFTLFLLNKASAFDQNPREYISRISTEIFKIVSNKKLTNDQKKKVLVDNFIDEIDFNWNARAVSGIYWKQMDDNQKNDFVKYYKEFLIKIWLPKFNGYNNEKYRVLDKYETLDNGDAIVPVEIINQNNTVVNISFRVKAVEKEYKIINVIAEGVDMARTYNVQFTDYADKYGVSELINYLKTGKSKDVSKAK